MRALADLREPYFINNISTNYNNKLRICRNYNYGCARTKMRRMNTVVIPKCILGIIYAYVYISPSSSYELIKIIE